MTEPLLIALLSAALADVTPLTAEQSVALATAYDGRDHRESAFDALLDNVRGWTPGLGDVAIRLEPDVEALAGDPEPARGVLCRLTGLLAQRTALPRPHAGVEEWFVRDASGRPLVVFVVGLARDHGWRDGDRVVIDARFYKRLDAVARDGATRAYPAFVGAFPRAAATTGPAPAAGAGPVGALWIMALPVGVLLLVFLLLLAYTRRSRPERRARRRIPAAPTAEPLDPEGALPDDPADALAELRRRAD